MFSNAVSDGHEVKELEDEADLLAAQLRERVLAESGDVGAVDQDLAGARRVEAGDQPEQRRLAAARGADDGQEAAGGNREIERMQNRQWTAAALDRLRYAAQLDHRSLSRTGSSARQIVPAMMRAPSALG